MDPGSNIIGLMRFCSFIAFDIKDRYKVKSFCDEYPNVHTLEKLSTVFIETTLRSSVINHRSIICNASKNWIIRFPVRF